MNRKSLEVISKAYKPTKLTMVNSVQILESTSGNIVIKEKQKNIRELYDYLTSRSFSYFPNLIDDTREGINVFQYVPDTWMPKEQKAMDFIKVVALLHQKTTYDKEVSLDDYQKIYEKVEDQINYLNYFYDDLYNEYFKQVFPSPSEYLLLTNMSKIFASLTFAKKELESWFSKVKDLKKFRICQIHNNLSLEHFHKNEKDYLLSWEKSRRDSPILDLVKFYQENYFDLPFDSLLKEYAKICPWSEEEKQLFFILISIPFKFDLKGSEMKKIQNIRTVLDYVYKTEELIRPYYAIEQEQK